MLFSHNHWLLGRPSLIWKPDSQQAEPPPTVSILLAICQSDFAKHPRIQRHIVFFGETGTGKSSAINLLLENGPFASVSNGSQPCTPVSAGYKTTLNGTKYNLWDTRGLGEGQSFLRAIFGRGSVKELKKFLKERHQKHEIDLLVYCVRGSRATTASMKYYHTFCAITRQLAAPVVIVVTQLEKEKHMEDWWNRNSSGLEKLGMEFDDHACITTLPENQRLAESKERLVDLITRNRHWEPQDNGSYFGSPVQKVTPPPPPPPHQGGISNRFRARNGAYIDDGGLNRRTRNHSGPSIFAPSTRNSSYCTATESPKESTPPSPTTPSTVKVPHINTGLLGVSHPPQPPSEEASSTGSSMFNTSSCTSHSEVHLQAYTEENEGFWSELPFRHSAAIVRRRKNYPIRRGGFGDIWECDLISGESLRMVAVKAVKTDINGYEDLRSHEKKLHRELKVWARLRHKNVVPLLGVVSDFGPLPSMMLLSEKHRLLHDIAAGLCYLHSQEVIHGDLHSDNVLIDEHGTACLTDFGLSLIKDFVGTSYLKSSICGGVQFADPALVQRVYSSQGKVFYPTKPCDVYSFGGLMLHVLSGTKPYDGTTTPIFLTVLQGERPHIPTHNMHITQWHKSAIRKCWDHEEHKRPSAAELVRMFDWQ
ncbi:kinase-like domain-containing protein [Lanmaoa asiatica]|nr:kinase-like domain-containing protein [Lanmaoa asiatica]